MVYSWIRHPNCELHQFTKFDFIPKLSAGLCPQWTFNAELSTGLCPQWISFLQLAFTSPSAVGLIDLCFQTSGKSRTFASVSLQPSFKGCEIQDTSPINTKQNMFHPWVQVPALQSKLKFQRLSNRRRELDDGGGAGERRGWWPTARPLRGHDVQAEQEDCAAHKGFLLPRFCDDFTSHMKRWSTRWIQRMMTLSTTWRQCGWPTRTNFKR